MKLQLGSYEAQALERALNDWRKLFTGDPSLIDPITKGSPLLSEYEAIRYRGTVSKIYDRLLSGINDE